MGVKIPCDELRPGDGLSFGGHHVALFASWVTPAKKHFNIYQRKGAANVAQRGRSEHLTCIRRRKLIEDVEPDNLDAIALPHDAGDEEEVPEFDGLDDPEPDDYNGECDHLPGLWRAENCDAGKPSAEVFSQFFV